ANKLFDANNLIYHYKLALAQVESRPVEYKEREVKYSKKIRTLEFYNEFNNECIKILKKKLETLKIEKDGVDGKLAGLLKALKDLDNLIESQRPLPTIESTSGDDQNRNSSTFENGESTDSILSKSAVKFVKAAERSTTNKVETVKKPSVRYAELYRKPSKKYTVRGNQRNWNNLKSQQLAIHRPYIPPIRTTRPNTNAATRPYVNSAQPQTTQELMIILIQRVQRLERELKAITSIHKVDRGRSRSAMAWVPKKGNSETKLKDSMRLNKEVVDYILQVKIKLLIKKLEDSDAEHQV
nr:hypothetical protein [Tanacetum cinerariifolium]